jgi:hypothetical protein
MSLLIVRISGRIASDLEELSEGRVVASEEQADAATRHRGQLAESAQKPKKLSTRWERNSLRAELKLQPK